MRRAVAAALVFLAACTNGGNPGPGPSQTVSQNPTPRQGGQAVFGAEQWPECINPITSCGSQAWTWYVVLEHVLPRAMQLDEHGNYVASPLLVHAPSLANGEVRQNPFTVTFRLSDRAVWEDGSPITSSGIEFTWRAIESTPGAYNPAMAGYDLIDSVETIGPQTAIIHFRDLYANWPDLFGGVHGFILKEEAFPRVKSSDHPDLSNEMQDDIPFSGGPFELLHWTGHDAVLVRNANFFGQKALLDQVTFLPLTDQPDEIAALESGNVSAIYPQPSEFSLIDRCAGCRDVMAMGGDGTYVEVLWLDTTAPPLDRLEVRQALLHAMDRQTVVDQIVKLNNPNAQVLNCGLMAAPNIGPWCRDRPFERFTYDPALARSILEGAGYDCAATPCTKDGESLKVRFAVLATSTRRTTTQEILVKGAAAAGFQLLPANIEADSLFGLGLCLTGGSRPIGECAFEASPDPSVTALLACHALPNQTRWCNPEAAVLMKAADKALDPTTRLDLMSQVYELQAADAIGLPLYVLPAVSVWRADQIDGPIGAWNGSPYGLFLNMNEWYLP